jgi:bifunctional N-acetylglucosamine-1-phosphate-uridyltransferase/glucosamine-1-phosphate-acetyltransferase GlmU-like protein
VLFVTQPNPLGTADAVFSAYNLMRDFTGSSLVVWGTQPVIRPKTFARAAKLARVFELYDMVLPTTFVEYPYAPIQRNEVGAIEAAIETHLETAPPSEFGETNIGLFILKNQTMFHGVSRATKSLLERINRTLQPESWVSWVFLTS